MIGRWPRISARRSSCASTRRCPVRQPLPVHHLAVPGREAPGRGRAAGPRAPRPALGRARRRAAPDADARRRRTPSRRWTSSGGRSAPQRRLEDGAAPARRGRPLAMPRSPRRWRRRWPPSSGGSTRGARRRRRVVARGLRPLDAPVAARPDPGRRYLPSASRGWRARRAAPPRRMAVCVRATSYSIRRHDGSAGVQVEQHVGRPGVAVARLPDRAGVQQLLALEQLDRALGRVAAAGPAVALRVVERDVAVADQRHAAALETRQADAVRRRSRTPRSGRGGLAWYSSTPSRAPNGRSAASCAALEQ